MQGIIWLNADLATAQQYRDTYSKLFGLPEMGTHLNENGINVDLNDLSKPGWTSCYCELFQHPDGTRWAHILDQAMKDALEDPDFLSNITSGEETFLQTQNLSEVTLDSSWIEEV